MSICTDEERTTHSALILARVCLYRSTCIKQCFLSIFRVLHILQRCPWGSASQTVYLMGPGAGCHLSVKFHPCSLPFRASIPGQNAPDIMPSKKAPPEKMLHWQNAPKHVSMRTECHHNVNCLNFSRNFQSRIFPLHRGVSQITMSKI